MELRFFLTYIFVFFGLLVSALMALGIKDIKEESKDYLNADWLNIFVVICMGFCLSIVIGVVIFIWI